MQRRTFLNNTLIAALGSFISVRSLEALSLNKEEQIISDSAMDSNDIIPAPDDPAMWDLWRTDLYNWKSRKQQQLKYDGSSYRTEPFHWVTSNFACCFVMMYDAEFYDVEKDEYTVSKLIERGKNEFGGYDSVVLWHAYPRIGLDERNQFDFYREMPHGLTGLKDVVSQFHDAGIKVFTNYNPWDTGTRRESKADVDLLIETLRSIDADGIFLDTMKNAPDFREKLDAFKPGIVMEGEIALPLEHVQTHHMSWAQWFKDSYVPGVYRNKWFERCHMQHAIARLNPLKSEQLQTAWMNGSGMLIWENVFGLWLGWNENDKGTFRTIHSIQQYFADIFSGEFWTPLSQESPLKGVFINLWEKDKIKLWTLINRNEAASEGILMETDLIRGMEYYDLVSGEKILPVKKEGSVSFTGRIAPWGIACLLAIPDKETDSAFDVFLARQKELNIKRSEDTVIPLFNNIVISKPVSAKDTSPKDDMISIPASSTNITMEYNFRECGAYGNIQDHLLLSAKHRLHSLCTFTKQISVNNFAIDKTPVTNAQYQEFMRSSGYKPEHPENFLKHWIDGVIPTGKEDHPVVYVDLPDAKAYAGWAGKRLPSEEEWQIAAQGPDGLLYPWGNELEDNKYNRNTNGVTTAVKSFPDGKSSYGCYDMCGNTWELTANEYSDGRTRFVMLKGGSCFKAEGSVWYMDGGPQKNSFFAKMLLMWPGLDRCSTVGFRCVVDL